MASVHAGQLSYELHSLGWKAFQSLCAAVGSETWGQTLQTFHDSRDAGRDGAFHGTWKPTAAETFDGSFVIQCKFTARAHHSIQLADLKDELPKAERLAQRGLANNYILFVSSPLSAPAEAQMKAAFEAVPGIQHFAAFGRERISQMIHESPRLRMLVPRIYGLGDLSQILDQRAYDQAGDILSSLGDDLSKFVITDAHRRSIHALTQHSFVLLLGEPACGKSTIAAALALGALDQWGCFTVKARDADDFVRHSNPHEAHQFFWVDDAFGTTQLDYSAVADWNRALPHLAAAIRRGARVVFTSRDYIYRAARNHLKESALPVLQEAQVVIRVNELSKEERDQILYNHIRLGSQPVQFKRDIKPHLSAVAGHEGFTPEIARRLGNPVFTGKLALSRKRIEDFVARPMSLLQEIIRTLDASIRCAIALVFLRAGNLRSPISLTPEEERALTLMGATRAEVLNALTALDGSLLLRVRQGGEFAWRFKHPTIRDAFAALVAENPELLDIYLAGAPLETLFTEVSCGDLGIEGVKVIVPQDCYPQLMTRMRLLGPDRLKAPDRAGVNRFLAHRCDRSFLELLLARRPDFLASLNVSSYLSVVSDVSVIVRLHEFRLLPETERTRHVAAIHDLAVDTPDAGFVNGRIGTLLLETDRQQIFDHVRDDLLPHLRHRVEEWSDHHDGKDDPDDYFGELRLALTTYRDAFTLEADEDSVARIDRAVAQIDKAVDELWEHMPEDPDDEYHGYGRSAASDVGGDRSVFDDVDH